jgi:hypothetical protein
MEDAEDDEALPLETPNGLTNDERPLKTLHELCGTVTRFESEAKAHTSTPFGPVDIYGVRVVSVKQEAIDIMVGQTRGDASQSKLCVFSILCIENIIDLLS